MPRLTKDETRAKALCADAHHYGGLTITVEWIKSRTWGFGPAIRHNGRRIANSSGCGYDKISATLADALRHLFPDGTDAHRAIQQTAGAGERSTIRALAAHGWTLTPTASGRTFNAYELRPTAKGE